jgi:hypothetical protein
MKALQEKGEEFEYERSGVVYISIDSEPLQWKRYAKVRDRKG